MRMVTLILALVLTAPAFADDNVVVVLDTSGSMEESMVRGQSKMDAAKEALLNVVHNLPPQTNFGVVTFNGWAIPLGLVTPDNARQSIFSQQPGGMTPLGEFMKVGADALLEKRSLAHGYGTYTLLVITDGEASDENLLNQYVPDIVSRGITLKTIGVKMVQDHTLKQQSVAYYSVDDLDALREAITSAIAEVAVSRDGESDYDMIKSLPDEMASQIVSTLTQTTMLNHKIGEKPVVVDENGQIVVEEEDSSGLSIFFIFVAFVAIGLVAALFIIFLVVFKD